MISIFVLPTMVTPGLVGRLVGDVFFSALLVAGAVTVVERRWRRFIVVAAAAALLMRWVALVAPSGALAIWREASTLVSLLLFAATVAAQVYRRGPVTHHRIQGAVAVYLLLGLIWANAYEILHLVQPGAFSGVLGAEPPVPQTWNYYSFVTLTTMGYGDIAPVHPVARSLAIAEALTGQLFLAVTLARLVALHVGARDKE